MIYIECFLYELIRKKVKEEKAISTVPSHKSPASGSGGVAVAGATLAGATVGAGSAATVGATVTVTGADVLGLEASSRKGKKTEGIE